MTGDLPSSAEPLRAAAAAPPAPPYRPPPDDGRWLVWADAQVAVCDKPAGLLSEPGRGPGMADCLWARLVRQQPAARVAHRLDMATSGLMVFALGDEPLRHLHRQFRDGTVAKAYEAWVQGLVDDDEGRIDLPIAADWPRRPLRRIDPERGAPSSTRYRVIERDATRRRTRLALQPLTGRTHQLRVHLAAIGHPIEGDALYGPAAPVPQAPAAAGADRPAPRLALHATRLAFAHPADGRWLAFESPAPF